MRKLLFAVLGLVLMAAPAFAEGDCGPATQGQLATQLVWRLGLAGDNLPAQEAMLKLSEHGVAPSGGWVADQPLTKGAFGHVMNQIYASFDTNFPDKTICGCRLDGILQSEDDQTSSFWQWRHNERMLTEN